MALRAMAMTNSVALLGASSSSCLRCGLRPWRGHRLEHWSSRTAVGVGRYGRTRYFLGRGICRFGDHGNDVFLPALIAVVLAEAFTVRSFLLNIAGSVVLALVAYRLPGSAILTKSPSIARRR